MNEHIHIHKVKNFETHKQTLIDLIFSLPKTRVAGGPKERISHSDWTFPENHERQYFSYMLKHIMPDFSRFICGTYGVNSINFQNVWFQVYEFGDYHNLHTHPLTNFTNILYVELPDKNLVTNIIGQNEKKISLDISEGDILTFPAFLKHGSKPNNSNKRKIVIAFNTSLIKV